VPTTSKAQGLEENTDLLIREGRLAFAAGY